MSEAMDKNASADTLPSSQITSADAVTGPRRFKVGRSRPVRATGSDSNVQAKFTGFGPMSRISTSFGEVYAQALREGDMVRTKNGEFLKIAAINRITLGEGYMKYHPAAQPIVIRAGGLGPGLPTADLTLAPNQKLHATQGFLTGPLLKAVDAVDKPHVYRQAETLITYTNFHCGRPATVCSEGIWIDTAP
ncbi:MAG: Hint domain-containing protein [Marinosulfonomonas sp.]|nr:Hint domain-containing protein [Marinosulfonomonas sp.]